MPLCVSHVAYADTPTTNLRMQLAAELLKASEDDTSMTKQEKLFIHRCKAIEKHLVYSETPLGQAMKYSCTAPVVGVAFYAGKDLGEHSPQKVAVYIESEFAKNGVKAKVFIKENHEYGSNVAYLIEGGREVMNPINPLKAIKNIQGFVSEVKLVFFKDKKITSTQLEEWVKATTPYIPNVS